MSGLREKLKNIVESAAKILDWVGVHLGAILTIFSAVIAMLFLRERQKRMTAEAKAELSEQAHKIEAKKNEVKQNEQQANDSLADYDAAIDAYNSAPGKRVNSYDSLMRKRPKQVR